MLDLKWIPTSLVSISLRKKHDYGDRRVCPLLLTTAQELCDLGDVLYLYIQLRLGPSSHIKFHICYVLLDFRLKMS